MEGNKDEAAKCVRLALKYASAGFPDKASKFLAKAERMYPEAPGLAAARAAVAGGAANGGGAPGASPASGPSASRTSARSAGTANGSASAGGPSSRPAAGSTAPSGSPGVSQARAANLRQRRSNPSDGMGAQKPFTPQQEAEARRIVKCTCHYEVLGIAKSADETTIKKAYRKVGFPLDTRSCGAGCGLPVDSRG